MNQKKRTKLLSTLLVSLIVLLSGIYVFQVIESGEKKYLIGSKQKELILIEKENSSLKLAVSKNTKLTDINTKVKELGYAKTGKFEFIVIPSSSVAINN